MQFKLGFSLSPIILASACWRGGRERERERERPCESNFRRVCGGAALVCEVSHSGGGQPFISLPLPPSPSSSPFSCFGGRSFYFGLVLTDATAESSSLQLPINPICHAQAEQGGEAEWVVGIIVVLALLLFNQDSHEKDLDFKSIHDLGKGRKCVAWVGSFNFQG